tara:strand:- start:203 stop:748 length:546 start_codon:yes stop_codon:yes gene_type:complete
MGFFLIFFAFFVFFAPNYLGHPDNYIEANALVTPAHIVPEWYFLPFYAILRSITFDVLFIPAKLMGVILMFGSILILFILPWLDTARVRSAKYRPIYKYVFWVFLIDCIVLGWVGAQPAEGTALIIGQIGTFYYFIHFLVVMPVLGKIETPLPLPASIAEPVTGGGGGASAGAAAAKMEKS